MADLIFKCLEVLLLQQILFRLKLSLDFIKIVILFVVTSIYCYVIFSLDIHSIIMANLVSLIVIIVLLSNQTWKNRLCIFLTLMACTWFNDLFELVSFPYQPISSYGIVLSLFSVTLIMMKMMDKHSLFEKQYLTISQLLLFSGFLMGISLFTIVLFHTLIENQVRLYKVSIAIIIVLCMFILCILILKAMIDKNKYSEKYKINKELLDKQKQYYVRKLAMDQEIRQVKHDLNNHFFVLDTYMSSGKIEEARQYIKTLHHDFSSIQIENLMDHYLFNILINDLLREQQNKEVSLSIIGTIPPRFLIEDVDFCILFSNLLKNSFEAAREMEKNKEIEIIIEEMHHHCRFTIKNTYKNDIKKKANGEWISTKDSSSRGCGTQNILAIVEKYNGKIEYFAEEEWFICKMIFALESSHIF